MEKEGNGREPMELKEKTVDEELIYQREIVAENLRKLKISIYNYRSAVVNKLGLIWWDRNIERDVAIQGIYIHSKCEQEVEYWERMLSEIETRLIRHSYIAKGKK